CCEHRAEALIEPLPNRRSTTMNDRTTDDSLPTAPACPPWCERPAGHPYSPDFDLDTGEGYWRLHVATMSPLVCIEAAERYRVADGSVVLAAPTISVSGDAADEELTPARAYDLGDDLNSAARR